MCGPSLSSFHRSPGSSSCGCANGTANAARLIALLFVMTLAASGCTRWVEPTAATSPAPLTPGAVVTGEWSYTYRGETFTEPASGCTCPLARPGTCSCGSRALRLEADGAYTGPRIPAFPH